MGTPVEDPLKDGWAALERDLTGTNLSSGVEESWWLESKAVKGSFVPD